jgi:hypothetical protein
MRSVSLGYFDLPKCASTSIKSALHLEEYGFPFEDRKRSTARGGKKNIHGFLNREIQGELSSAQHRIIVVRDPVERFLSAYASRVTGHMELSETKVKQKYLNQHNFDEPGFIFNPGIGQFLEYLPRYLQVRPIEWHLRPLAEHLPQGLDQFTRVHLIKRLDLVQAHLSEIYGKDIRLPHLQTVGQHVSIKQLSSSQLEQIIDFCQSDYELLKPWFNPDQAWSQWKSGQHAWVYSSTARRFEQSLKLSRIPESLLINNIDSKKISYVASSKALTRPEPRRLMDSALKKGGALVSYIALAPASDVACEPYYSVGSCRWKVLFSTSNFRIAQFWQHASRLRYEFADNEPDLVHCYGLRNAALVKIALSRLNSKAGVIVELPLSISNSPRPFRFIPQILRRPFIRLVCSNRRVAPLFQLASEGDRIRLQKYQASAFFVPVVDGNLIHLSTIDSSSHGVVFINASSLQLNEVADAGALITALMTELKTSEALPYLKILLPFEQAATQALLKGGLEPHLNSSGIRILQKSSSILSETQSSQVVVIPSLRSRAARQSIIEAQQVGRPVVAPNDSYGRFLVAHSSSGYLFSDGDFDLAAKNVKRFISTRGLPEKMGLKGKLHIETNFTSAKAFEVMVEQYNSML